MDEKKPQLGAETKAADEFQSIYANHVQVELGPLDLRLIFGELLQTDGKWTVNQHTSMRIPWAIAKLLRFFLNVNIVSFENQFGKIQFPPNMIPPAPDRLFTEEQKKDPNTKKTLEDLGALYNQFIASL